MICKICGGALEAVDVISDKGLTSMPLCPRCDEGAIVDMKARNKRVLTRKMTECGVPELYTGSSLSASDMLFPGKEDVINAEKGIYYIGETGTGKTYRLAGWCSLLLSMGVQCRFYDFSDFVCDLRADFKRYNDHKREMLRAECIFFDNFDPSNQYMYDFIFNLVNALYTNRRQVFFSSLALPPQSQLAMRISQMTIQLELQKGGGNAN